MLSCLRLLFRDPLSVLVMLGMPSAVALLLGPLSGEPPAKRAQDASDLGTAKSFEAARGNAATEATDRGPDQARAADAAPPLSVVWGLMCGGCIVVVGTFSYALRREVKPRRASSRGAPLTTSSRAKG